MYFFVNPRCGTGSIADRGGVFQGIFRWQLILSQLGRKWLNQDLMTLTQ